MFAAPLAPAKHHRRHHYKPHDPGCRTKACDERVDEAWADWEAWVQEAGHSYYSETGQMDTTASWYDQNEGPTACGPHEALGVANKTLPCGTRVRICYAGCEIAVVDDRGPFVAGRELDLSAGAKAAISCTDLCPVRYSVIG